MQRLPEATHVQKQNRWEGLMAKGNLSYTELAQFQWWQKVADFTLSNKKRPMESRAAQDTRLCGAHNQMEEIAC